MVNGIVSLISLFVFSVYKNARDFCVLILYPETLLYSLISSINFLVASLGFSSIVSCHLQTVRVLLIFQSGVIFITFTSLTAVLRTSNTMLDNSGKSEHLVLFLILGEMLTLFHH